MPHEPARVITDLDDLRTRVELSEIFLAEEHAARKGKSSVALDKVENNAENPAHVSLGITAAPSRLVFRVKVIHESLAARVTVEYEASYSSPSVITVPREILEKFATDVLINTLFRWLETRSIRRGPASVSAANT